MRVLRLSVAQSMRMTGIEITASRAAAKQVREVIAGFKSLFVVPAAVCG